METMTIGILYETGIDKWKASMAIKCIDQIPIPIANAPVHNQTYRVTPFVLLTRIPKAIAE